MKLQKRNNCDRLILCVICDIITLTKKNRTNFFKKYDIWDNSCAIMKAKEQSRMISSFFTADYRNGRARFGGKQYPAGVFAVHLLNQFYVNDTAARIAVFWDSLHFHILRQPQNGYLNVSEFVKTGANTLEAVKTLSKLRPFDGVDTEAIQETTVSLFTEEIGQEICEYFAAKAKLSLLPKEEIAVGTAQRMIGDFSETEQRIAEIKSILRFFDTLADRLDFDRYYSLMLTDFFEGLHFGHYPRKCEICGRYFLMQSARRQKYCSYGIAPEPYRGKSISCRKYAAVLNRKEKAKNDPVKAIYDLRCAAIRTECDRGNDSEGICRSRQTARQGA